MAVRSSRVILEEILTQLKEISRHISIAISKLDNGGGQNTEKEVKTTGLHGIPEVMEGVMDAQKKHVERMKEKELGEKVMDKLKTTFPQDNISELKVSCNDCKGIFPSSQCKYDYAMSRYQCGKCQEQVLLNKKMEEKEKLDAEIRKMTDKNSKE